ncbi:hypothetical protein Tco_0233001 [Tanacetum coccineum]
MMFQKHQGESHSEAWTHFKELLQKFPHHGIDLWLQVKIFYDHVNPVTRRTIDQSAGGKLRDRNAKESWALLEDLALYGNEMNKISSSFEIYSGPHNTQYCMKIPSKLLLIMRPRVPTKGDAITDRITGALPSDMVKNPKLNFNSTYPVLSARTYSTEDPQCST